MLPVAWETIDAPPAGSIYDYTLESPAGAYGFLVVAWIAQGNSIFEFDSWVVLGFYPDPSDPSAPGEVVVTNGTFRTIDLTADLTLVPVPPYASSRVP